ncbi:hypothetical protein XENTR_v10012596 [Xenopus tropicalis]|nr:hypothetical protein XENTR_v10012596 [Xenopus tropicalis]
MASLQAMIILLILSLFLTEAFPTETPKGSWRAAVIKETYELGRIAAASLVFIVLIILLSIIIVWLKWKIKMKISDERLQTSSKDALTMTETAHEEHELQEVIVIGPKKTEEKKDEEATNAKLKKTEKEEEADMMKIKDKEETDTRKNTLAKDKEDDQRGEPADTDVEYGLEENKKKETEIVGNKKPKKKRLKKAFFFCAPLIKKIQGRKK